MRIFLLEPTKHDVSQLHDMGEVVEIFPQGHRRASIWSEDFKHQLLDRLTDLDYEPTKDFIAFTGHVLGMLFLLSVISNSWGREGDYIQALLFDAPNSSYVQRRL